MPITCMLREVSCAKPQAPWICHAVPVVQVLPGCCTGIGRDEGVPGPAGTRLQLQRRQQHRVEARTWFLSCQRAASRAHQQAVIVFY